MRSLKVIVIVLWSLIGLAIIALLLGGIFFGWTPFSGFYYRGAGYGDAELVTDSVVPVADVDEIKLDLISDECDIIVTDGDSITVKHYVRGMPEGYRAEVIYDGGSLTVATGSFQRLDFFSFGVFDNISSLEIGIPQSYAGALEVELTSGDVHVEGGLELARLDLDVSSGDISAEGPIKTGEAGINVTSGNVKLTGGLDAGEYTVEIGSGDFTVDNMLKGSGGVEVTSGNVRLLGVEIAEHLGVDVTSGDVSITLLGDPGLEFTAEKTSGDIDAYFDTGDGDWHSYSATVGDAPYRRLSLNVTSGNIAIRH